MTRLKSATIGSILGVSALVLAGHHLKASPVSPAQTASAMCPECGPVPTCGPNDPKCIPSVSR